MEEAETIHVGESSIFHLFLSLSFRSAAKQPTNLWTGVAGWTTRRGTRMPAAAAGVSRSLLERSWKKMGRASSACVDSLPDPSEFLRVHSCHDRSDMLGDGQLDSIDCESLRIDRKREREEGGGGGGERRMSSSRRRRRKRRRRSRRSRRRSRRKGRRWG